MPKYGKLPHRSLERTIGEQLYTIAKTQRTQGAIQQPRLDKSCSSRARALNIDVACRLVSLAKDAVIQVERPQHCSISKWNIENRC